MQVRGDGLKADKETGEQEDGDGGNWTHKGGHLEGREGDRSVTGMTRTDSGLGRPLGFPHIHSLGQPLLPPPSPRPSMGSPPASPSPVGNWRRLRSATPKTGPPRPWQWPGLRRAGSGWSQLAGLSSSIRCCSIPPGTPPGEWARGWAVAETLHSTQAGASRPAIARASRPGLASTFLFMLSHQLDICPLPPWLYELHSFSSLTSSIKPAQTHSGMVTSPSSELLRSLPSGPAYSSSCQLINSLYKSVLSSWMPPPLGGRRPSLPCTVLQVTPCTGHSIKRQPSCALLTLAQCGLRPEEGMPFLICSETFCGSLVALVLRTGWWWQ